MKTKIANRIVELRQERGMTSERLAIEIGISKSGLRYVERGMKDVRISTLVLIAGGLKVPITDLLSFKE